MKQAIQLARQFDRLYAQVRRELRRRNPSSQRIDQLKRDASKVSKQLLPLLSPEPRRVKQSVKQ